MWDTIRWNGIPTSDIDLQMQISTWTWSTLESLNVATVDKWTRLDGYPPAQCGTDDMYNLSREQTKLPSDTLHNAILAPDSLWAAWAEGVIYTRVCISLPWHPSCPIKVDIPSSQLLSFLWMAEINEDDFYLDGARCWTPNNRTTMTNAMQSSTGVPLTISQPACHHKPWGLGCHLFTTRALINL